MRCNVLEVCGYPDPPSVLTLARSRKKRVWGISSNIQCLAPGMQMLPQILITQSLQASVVGIILTDGSASNWARELQQQRKTEGGYCTSSMAMTALLASLLAMANPCAMRFCHIYFLGSISAVCVTTYLCHL